MNKDLLNKVLIKYIEKIDINKIKITNDKLIYRENERKIKYKIKDNDTWITLKKRIDVYLDYLYNCQTICPYCMDIINKKVYCEKCKLEYCLNCYLEKLRKNKGIIDCFNCNYKFGKECNDSEIIIKSELIMNKYN